MDNNGPIMVLLACETAQDLFDCRKLLERRNCQCHLAKSEPEIAELLKNWEFDVVLSTLRISDGSVHRLATVLSGSPVSVFYSVRVDEGYWWLPAVTFGTECLGTPAFQPREFIDVLSRLLIQIKANITAPLALSQSL
jgi:hypothetical protein